MEPNEAGKSKQPKSENKHEAETGNASNSAPNDLEQDYSNQVLNKKAEKYLREVANIEDLPDANDQKDMDTSIEKEKDK